MKRIIALGGSNSKNSINKKFAHWAAHKVEDAEVEVIWEIARLFLNYPGGREYWEQNKSGFYPDFVTWIDAKIDSDKEFAARESTSC